MSESPVTLTNDVAVKWLEEKLLVKSVRERVEREPLQFLNEVLRAYQREIPFQTVTMASRPLESRRVATKSEIIEAMLSLKGGVCVDLNFSFHYLLEALGYDSYVAGSNYIGNTEEPFNHVVVVVNNLENASYVVDVGCGYPTFHAIPLADLPHTYTEAGLEVRYLREGDTYFRLHRKGDISPEHDERPEKGGEGFRIMFDFDLTPRTLDYVQEEMREFFATGPFYDDLHLCVFPSDSDLRMIAFEKWTKYELGETMVKTKQPLETLESQVLSCFPNLPKEEVRLAMAHYLNVWKTAEK